MSLNTVLHTQLVQQRQAEVILQLKDLFLKLVQRKPDWPLARLIS